MADYPTDEELDKIEQWQGSLKELIEFVESRWWTPSFGFIKSPYGTEGVNRLELHTAGWSGNESIMSALKNNYAFWNFWRKTEAGGHFYFEFDNASEGIYQALKELNLHLLRQLNSKRMKVSLVFEDWRKSNSGESVYQTEKGVQLSMGDFHAGTTFNAEIEFDADNQMELRKAISEGYTPVFAVYLSKEETNG